MEITEANIRELVEQVVKSLDGQLLRRDGARAAQAGVLPDIESAVRAARTAHQELMKRTLETRRKMVAAMREAAVANVQKISQLAVEETGMGRVEDKVLKN